ncbi:endolytic transglycosylase MltG [Clostridiaceae bacterium M8S5]|nr:endolytic transglycosylase MltG [Clostridiaceae bacterium M8S5]
MGNVEGMIGHKKKSKKIILIVLLLFVVAVAFGAKKYYDYLMMPVSSTDTNDVEIVIPNGSSTANIASILKTSDLIKNEKFFVLISRYKKTSSKYKAGTYVLNKSMGVEELMAALIKGGKNKESVTITIPEGYEIRQIADKLKVLKDFNKDNFLKLASDASKYKDKYEFLKDVPQGQGLEGYLFPNTYEVYAESTEVDVIEKMLDEFMKIYDKEIKGKKLYKDFNIHDLITMASIVERETKSDEERPIVASVFYNRLGIKMRLGSCATVQYALGERKPKLSTADTKIKSPYNTYINDGLPIGPIASPGLKSIVASVNPDNTDYLYFVLTDYDKGKHTFTNNYKDFLIAKKSAKQKN